MSIHMQKRIHLCFLTKEHPWAFALGATVIPEQSLYVHNGFGISHVVLLRNHGAFLINHDHGVRKRHAAAQEAVQAAQKHADRAQVQTPSILTRGALRRIRVTERNLSSSEKA